MVDELQLYFGHPHIVDIDGTEGVIKIVPPKLGKVIKFGQSKFYSTINIFICNTTMYRSLLWDMGMDWNEVSNFQLFSIMYQMIDDEASSLFIPDVKFSNMQIYEKEINGETQIILYDPINHIEINEEVYTEISQCVRHIFKMYPEDEFTEDKWLKDEWINKDIREAERNKNKPQEFSILPIISAYVNHPGTKYKLSELEEVNVCEFYDSIERLQIYEQSTALLKGMYSGMIDASGISDNEYNFMRSGTTDKTKK